MMLTQKGTVNKLVHSVEVKKYALLGLKWKHQKW